MLKIRLTRIGAKKKPFYRVVVVDERAKRTGAYIELLGTYNPLTEPKDIKLKQDRIDHWVKQGAQPSTGYLRIIGKAPQRPPRKPKKEKKSDGQAEAIPTQTKEGQKPTEEPAREEQQVQKEATGGGEEAKNETPTAETSESSNAPTTEEPATTESEKTI